MLLVLAIAAVASATDPTITATIVGDHVVATRGPAPDFAATARRRTIELTFRNEGTADRTLKLCAKDALLRATYDGEPLGDSTPMRSVAIGYARAGDCTSTVLAQGREVRVRLSVSLSPNEVLFAVAPEEGLWLSVNTSLGRFSFIGEDWHR